MTLTTEYTSVRYSSEDTVLDVLIKTIRCLEADGYDKYEVRKILRYLGETYNPREVRNRYSKMRQRVEDYGRRGTCI